MQKKDTIIAVPFSGMKSFEEIPAMDLNWAEKNIVDAQETLRLKTVKGHQAAWHDVYLNYSHALENVEGFVEGLKMLDARCCMSLRSIVGLPHSCKEANFDGSAVENLYNDEKAMTEGLEILSLNECKKITSLKGLPASVKKVHLNETGISSFEGMGKNVEVASARFCSELKTTKGLSRACKVLDLSFSSIEVLEDIPSSIEKIVLENCSSLKKESLKNVPPCVLPRIVTMDARIRDYAKNLYQIAKENQLVVAKQNAFISQEKNTTLNDDDIIYRIPQKTIAIKDVLKDIPQNVTVIDASNCPDLSYLDGLRERPSLRMLFLQNTQIDGFALGLIPPSVKYLDIRGCGGIKSYARLAAYPGIVVTTLFRGERILRTAPVGVHFNIEGSNILKKGTHLAPEVQKLQHVKD